MQRVLIIKERPDSLLSILDDLTLAGYFVSFATDTQKALNKIENARFDLILIDGEHSDAREHKIVAELRRASVMSPILILTNQEFELDKVISSSAPGQNPLEESADHSELLHLLHSVLRRTNGNNGNVGKYKFGNVVLDFKSYEATKNGKRIPLTSLEFDLLQYLISHKNEVLRREEIVDAVWGEGVIVDNRTVDTHIARLRKKLCDDPKRPKHFTSIRGVGYRFLG